MGVRIQWSVKSHACVNTGLLSLPGSQGNISQFRVNSTAFFVQEVTSPSSVFINERIESYVHRIHSSHWDYNCRLKWLICKPLYLFFFFNHSSPRAWHSTCTGFVDWVKRLNGGMTEYVKNIGCGQEKTTGAQLLLKECHPQNYYYWCQLLLMFMNPWDFWSTLPILSASLL